MEILALGLLYLVVIIALAIACRSVTLWYFRINDVVKQLETMNLNLQRLMVVTVELAQQQRAGATSTEEQVGASE